MSAERPTLITIDVVGTLGVFTGPSTEDVLAELSPLRTVARRLITEICHAVLDRHEFLSENLICTVCDELLIDRAAWPTPWPATGFIPYPDAEDALELLFPVARIVAVANLPVTENNRAVELEQTLGEYLFATHLSCDLGIRKPSREFWAEIAQRHNTAVDKIVHIGDRWDEDALGASHSGAQAIWISTTPPPSPDTTGRIHIATSMQEAAQLARELCGGPHPEGSP